MIANISGKMFAPRAETTPFVDFTRNEEVNSKKSDVKHGKPFMQPIYRTNREMVGLQTINTSERLNGGQRPTFTSLADVYEGALRNVLGIKLQLALDDQQSFTQEAISDLLFRDTNSSAKYKDSLRPESLKRRNEHRQYERGREESKDTKGLGSFQGRTLLRDPRRESSGASAFHVPPKKARMDEEVPFPERGFAHDHFGVPRAGAGYLADFQSSFTATRGSPSMFHRRMNAPEVVTHVYRTNGIHVPVPRDPYSLWPFGHNRDFSNLFPVRCSSVEMDRRIRHGFLEGECRRSMDLSRVNGFSHDKTAVCVKMEKDAREDVKYNRKPSITERRSSLNANKEKVSDRGSEREKLSPPLSQKSKTNSLLLSYRSSPVNNHFSMDFRMETRHRSALRKIELRRNGKKRNGEDEKEEFLFKLGLERIEL